MDIEGDPSEPGLSRVIWDCERCADAARLVAETRDHLAKMTGRDSRLLVNSADGVYLDCESPANAIADFDYHEDAEGFAFLANNAERLCQLASRPVAGVPEEVRADGINITEGIPSEIYVAIGRGRYDDENGVLDVAHDVAEHYREQVTATERELEKQTVKAKAYAEMASDANETLGGLAQRERLRDAAKRVVAERDSLREQVSAARAALEWIETEEMLDPENLVAELRLVAHEALAGRDPKQPTPTH